MRVLMAIAVYITGCLALITSLVESNPEFSKRKELTPKEAGQLLFSIFVAMSVLCLIYWKLVGAE